jgi:hypothetical protein
VKKRRVGDFWDSSWTPAPFEEAITIDQLAGLDLATLFKKRMVTDTRVQSILRALNRVIDFLDDRNSGEKSPGSEAKRVEGPSQEIQQRQKLETKQVEQRMASVDLRPADLDMSVESLAVWEALNNREVDLGPETTLVADLIAFFSPSSCVSIILGDELSKSEQQLLTRIVNKSISNGARELLCSLLRSPAVRVDNLAQALFGAELIITAHKRCIATVVARGLMAQQAKHKGQTFRGFWTTRPKLLSVIIKEATSPKSSSRSSKQGFAYKEMAASLDPFLHSLIFRRKTDRN